MSKRKWVALVDDQGKKLCRPTVVPLDYDSDDVNTLVLGVKKMFADSFLQGIAPAVLRVFKDAKRQTDQEEMELADPIDELGNSEAKAIIVQRPRTRAPVALVAPVPMRAIGERPPPAPLPEMKLLERAQELKDEALRLATQTPGSVYDIPRIHEFMRPLGGCTKTGQLYWREEERQLSLLLRNVPVDEYGRPAKRNIVVGSPGVGKSTMLCVLALYVALVARKNVLVLRQLKSHRLCLFVVRPTEDGSAKWFSMADCTHQEAVDTFNLVKRQPFATIRMLDGFSYNNLHSDLHAFHFLATSQPVDVKSGDYEHVQRYLFPCWCEYDLFALGKALYGLESIMVNPETGEDTGMVERFYYSGGNAREFTRDTIKEIRDLCLSSIANAPDPKVLLSVSRDTRSSPDQCDPLRRTFLERTDASNPKAYCWSEYWWQVVDSQYVISRLKKTYEAEDLRELFGWARRGGPAHATLAGYVFEIMIHRLASANTLRITTTRYDPGIFRQPTRERHFEFHQLELQKGKALCSGEDEDRCNRELVAWSKQEDYAYWYPNFRGYPTIDGVVKLPTGRLAYLQMTVSEKHTVDATKLAKLNELLGVEMPRYIVVCPSSEDAKAFKFETRGQGAQVMNVCEVFVGALN